jgi:hypothetical protein
MSQPPEGSPPGEQQPTWQQPGQAQPPPQPQPPQWGQVPPPGYGGQQPPPGYGQWGQQAPPGYGQQPPPGYGQPPQWSGFAAAAKPGIIPLRPLGVGEILDGAFTTMRRYPKATLGLSAIIGSVTALMQFLLALSLNSVSTSGDFNSLALLAGGVTVIVAVLGSVILSGMLTVVVGEAVLGKPIDLSAVWRRVGSRIGALIGAAFLVGLVVLVGFVLCILPGIYIGVALAFTGPALILEGQSVTNAMSRSRALVKGDWWRVFGILFLAAIIAYVVGAIVSVPFGLAGASFQFSREYGASVGVGSLVLQAIGSILSTTVSAPITAGATALLYIDRRMRREGLDVALAQAAAPPPAGTAW